MRAKDLSPTETHFIRSRRDTEPVTQEDCIDNDIIWPEEPVTQEDCIDNDIIWPEEPFRQEDCINNDIIWPEENIEKRRIAHTLQNEYMPLVVNLSFTTKSYDDITESEDVLQESKHQAHNQGKPAVEASSSIPRYPMNSNPRGICLICSNTEFSEARLAGLELSDRIGSSIDVSKLNSVFTWLKFDVQIRHEMTADQMYGCLREYAEYNHKEFDCFVCCILTHGCLQGLYGTDGKILNIAEATQLFTRLNSATLQEKPKLFFLQCCRGFSTDNSPSIDVLRRSTDVLESDFFIGYPTPSGQSPTAKISPVETNPFHETPHQFFLELQILTQPLSTESFEQIICYVDPGPSDCVMLGTVHCVSGYAAWRTLHGGSWYVDTLCRVFQEHAHIEDLLSIMILVNSEISKRADPDDKKQVPQPMFSLRKMLYFNPESPFDADVNV